MTSKRYTSKKCDAVGQSPSLRKHYPDLLRLDSVGEVSSAEKRPNWRCQKSDINKSDKYFYNNLVDTFNMGSLIDSASACFSTATSYFNTMCPYKTTANHFSKSESDKKSFNIPYIRNLFSRSDVNTAINNNMDVSNCLNFEPVMSWAADISNGNCSVMTNSLQSNKPVCWTNNILDTLNYNFLSDCQVKSNMKTCSTEPYVPPQKRHCLSQKVNTVDRNLKPYNARLLEKSKKLQVKRKNHSGTIIDHGKSTSNLRKQEEPTGCFTRKETDSDSSSVNVENMKKLANDSLCMNKKLLPSFSSYCGTACCLSDRNLTDACSTVDNQVAKISDAVEPEDNSSPTDWFEYECESVKCIPISEEKLQAATQKCAIKNADSSYTQGYGADKPQFYSWASVESDKAAQSTLIETMCNSSSSSPIDLKCDSDCLQQVSLEEISKKITETNEKNIDTLESGENNTKCQEMKQCTEDDLISVLYVRNLDKKRHCSAKKRRRRKAQQKEQVKKSEEANIQSCESAIPAHTSSAIAFILGYDPSDADNCIHSFQVACDISSDSEWTESDCESDEVYSSMEDDNILTSELGFQCNDPLSGMNISLRCMVEPLKPVAVSPITSSLDEINLSWQIYVAGEPESSKKPKTKKQVHFAKEKDLATVHPIIAWSHAYQAARKGPWEEYARDRGRFLRRITDTEEVLFPILQMEHRNRIYAERFSDNADHSMHS